MQRRVRFDWTIPEDLSTERALVRHYADLYRWFGKRITNVLFHPYILLIHVNEIIEKSTKKKCQTLQNIPHGIMKLSNDKLMSGTTAVYECIRGYRMQGNSEMRCRNGVWSGTTPICIGKTPICIGKVHIAFPAARSHSNMCALSPP